MSGHISKGLYEKSSWEWREGANIAPLFPVAHSYPSPEPVIDFRYRTIIFRYAEIVHPAPEILCKLLHAVFHGHEPASPGQTFDSPFKQMKSLVRPPNLGSFEGKSQEVRVIRFRHMAFLLVDLEFEPTIEKSLDTSGHSHSSPVTFHKLQVKDRRKPVGSS